MNVNYLVFGRYFPKSAANLQQKLHICKFLRDFLAEITFGACRRYQKPSLEGRAGEGLALRVVGVIGFATYLPQVRFPGLLAVRQVLLCRVVRLVGRDGLQVLRTRLDEATNLREALTSHELVLRHRSVTGDGTDAAQVNAGAVRVSGLCHTVGSQHHLLVGCVRRFLVDFGECTADGLNHVSIFGFCHVALAMLYLLPA